MKAFTANADRSAAVAELDLEERMVVARIVADVGLLLSGETFGMEIPRQDDVEDELFRHLRGLEESLADPADPAVLALLPNAAPTDREVADEFRRLTEADLRDVKVTRLRRVWEQLSEDGPEWEVLATEALSTAGALTDVRQVVASRLGIKTDDDARRVDEEIELASHAMETGADDTLPVNPERVWLGMLYQALGWLQESLVAFLTGEDEADDE